QSKALAHRCSALRRLAAVKLQQVGLKRVDACRELIVSGVNGKRDLLRPSSHALAKRARSLDADVTGRGRKEHETDEIGAGLERHIEGRGGLEAADLDQNRHGRGSATARFYSGGGVLSRLRKQLIDNDNLRLRRGRRNGEPRRSIGRHRMNGNGG